MKDSIRQFVIQLIEKKGKLPKNADIDSFNYIDTRYVDSIIKFIVEIESQYDIDISEVDIESVEFRTVGGVITNESKVKEFSSCLSYRPTL